MNKNPLRRFVSAQKATMIFVMAIGLSFFLLPFASYWSQHAAGTLSGKVFQDYNGNGTFDTAGSPTLPAIDAGVSGVTVMVYAANGTSRSAMTLADGTWSIDTSAAPAFPAGPYRVEFTNLPANFRPSSRTNDSATGGTTTNSGSTVQFVNNGTTANINLAINVPEDYCQNNPTLCTAILRPGNQSGSRSTSVSVPYDSPTVNTNLAVESQTGAVWGTAYKGSSKTIFQSALMKRHAGFGSLGTGGIYKIDLSSGSPVFGNYVNLQSIGLTTGTDPRVTAGYTLPNDGATPHWDYAAYTEVGKRAIGDLDYDAGRNTLWFINLNDRRLHGIKNVNPNVTPVNADLVRDSSNALGFAVNTATPITCNNGVLRPWGIKVYRGLVYVGAVCTGENTGATAADLVAYVLSINPDAATPVFTQVLSFPLNYTRTRVSFGSSAPWNPWVSSDSNKTITGGALPQPIVSDLEIDKDGSVIMAIKDRWGDQYAAHQYFPDPMQTSTTFVGEIYDFGDALRFCNSGGTLSNPGTTGCPNNPRPAAEDDTGVNGNAGGSQGPGGGEFYVGDWGPSDPDNFAETLHGALAFLPGSNRIVATSLDPNNYYSNGLKWLSNTDGSRLNTYNVFTGSSVTTTNDFNKGNGLGDVELLCDAAPIQIGNRIWMDSNNNGVQDAGEMPISGVTVQLFNGTTPVTYTRYRDDFSTVASYAGTNGLRDWSASPWTEIGETDGAAAGSVTVSTTGIGFGNAAVVTRRNRGLDRIISFAGSGSATLSYNYQRSGLGLIVDSSPDGTTYTALQTLAAGTDASPQTGLFPLPAGTTHIRFRSDTTTTGTVSVAFDNVQVTTNAVVTTNADGVYYYSSDASAPASIVDNSIYGLSLLTNTAYKVVIPATNFATGQALTGKAAAKLRNDATVNGTIRDSDGVKDFAGGTVYADVTTGASGNNNHTLDFGFIVAPTAANVSVGGRVVSPFGSGLRSIFVTLREANGNSYTAVTNSFGYYRFDNIQVGQILTVSVEAKRYSFAQTVQVVSLADNITDLQFTSTNR